MTWPLVVELAGPPRGKGRHRSRIVSRGTTPFMQSYADPETAKYETQLRYVAAQEMAGALPSAEPLAVAVTVVLPIAPSWTKKKQAAARAGMIRPTTKNSGDADNYLKILDGLNGIVWQDDAQVVEAKVSKIFGEAPKLRIEIEPIEVVLLLNAQPHPVAAGAVLAGGDEHDTALFKRTLDAEEVLGAHRRDPGGRLGTLDRRRAEPRPLRQLRPRPS